MKLVTARELAEMLSVSPRTIQDWGCYRGLPKVKISARCVRYSPSAVLEWLAGQGAFQSRVKPRPRRKRDQFSMTDY